MGNLSITATDCYWAAARKIAKIEMLSRLMLVLANIVLGPMLMNAQYWRKRSTADFESTGQFDPKQDVNTIGI